MENGRIELYYIRAVGWNKTVLLGVREKDGVFEVFNFELDPLQETLSRLYANSQKINLNSALVNEFLFARST